MALSTDGYLYGWGNNAFAHIGDKNTGNNQTISTPKKISDKTFQKISIGYTHSLALDTSGNIWSWGSNQTYRTGRNTANGYTDVPTQITSGITFKEISAGSQHSMALDASGNLYTWGSNSYGQLCTGNTTTVKTPTKVNTGNTKFTKIAAGTGCSMAIDTTKQLWGCGRQIYGNLGNGSSSNSSIKTFTQNITKTGKQFKDISISGYTVIAIDTNENLWGWGQNQSGQLGNNSTTNATSPIQILAGTKIKKVSLGTQYFIAITDNEDIYTCGYNTSGQLGNNSTTDSKTPVKITINN